MPLKYGKILVKRGHYACINFWCVNLNFKNFKGNLKSNILNTKISKYKAATKQYGKLEIIKQIKYSNFIKFNNKINNNQFTIDWNK